MRKKHRVKSALATIGVLGLAAGLIPSAVAHGDGVPQTVYTPTSANEANAYARVIQLEHAGADNGELLGTFEHWYTNGDPSEYIIKDSKDGGATWSTLSTVKDTLTGAGHPVSQMWQPYLFEFPKALGSYPAGTIMLVGNTVPASSDYTEFQEWLSFDHGATWKSMGAIQQGGTFGDGIWEPSLHLDTEGQLVMEFSDERDNAAHSQMISQMVSNDGGKTWSAPTPVVASPVQGDRPGMANVTRVGAHGPFVMAYEFCPMVNCAIHLKFSTDGLHWGAPGDVGSTPTTTDGFYLGHSPDITWVPNGSPDGELVLTGQSVYNDVDQSTAPISDRAVLVNTDAGKGAWHWATSPWAVDTSQSSCNANYSPDVIPVGSDGLIRYTAPTSISGQTACGEGTGATDIGVLPYRSTFATNGQDGWDDFGGTWTTSNGVMSETSGGDGGNKAIAGSTAWTNYNLSADIEATSAGSVDGVAVRVTDPAVGTDSYKGYLIFFDSGAGTFTIAKEDYGYEPLATVNVSGGVATNAWYHVNVKVVGNAISAMLSDPTGTPVASLSTKDPYDSFPSGMVALRDFNGTAAWKDLSVTAAH